jgi:hypothetical protein
MSQSMDEYTPEGRQIITVAPTGSRAAAQEVATKKIKALKASGEAKSKAKENLPVQSKAIASQEEIWPKRAQHSTGDEKCRPSLTP